MRKKKQARFGSNYREGCKRWEEGREQIRIEVENEREGVEAYGRAEWGGNYVHEEECGWVSFDDEWGRREAEARERGVVVLEDGSNGDILHLAQCRVVPLHGGKLLLGPLADAGGRLEELCSGEKSEVSLLSSCDDQEQAHLLSRILLDKVGVFDLVRDGAGL